MNERHYVNENKGVCTTVIEWNLLDDLLGEVSAIANSKTSDVMYFAINDSIKTHNIEIARQSKCHPDDKFDKDIGTVIATKKAYIDYHKKFIKAYEYNIKELKKAIKVCEELIAKHEKKQEGLKEGYDRYLNNLYN